MGLRNSYFALPGLDTFVRRLLHPYRHTLQASLRGKPLTVSLTQRATRQLALRDRPLVVEMQLYFSCVVKKRVLFHDTDRGNGSAVGERLVIEFRPVEAASCDPEEFARNYPEKRELTGSAARRLYPSALRLDFHHNHWQGDFDIGQSLSG